MFTIDWSCRDRRGVPVIAGPPPPPPTPPCIHPGEAARSRERVSSEETSTCQKTSTSRPSWLPSPSHPCASPAPSVAPITPFLLLLLLHLIQISALARAFVCTSILPVRWTEETGWRAGRYVMEGGRRKSTVFPSSEMSNSNGVKRPSPVSRV